MSEGSPKPPGQKQVSWAAVDSLRGAGASGRSPPTTSKKQIMALHRTGLPAAIATREAPPGGLRPAPNQALVTPANRPSSGLAVDRENRVAWRRRIEITLPLGGKGRDVVVELLLL